MSLTVGVSRPNPDPLDRPIRPISTRFQPEPMLLLAGDGFPRPRPDANGSSGGFSSPKLELLDSTDVICKSGQLRQVQAYI